MNADTRILFRIFLCVAFIASLYGGMTLLTAVMFAKGHTIIAVLSGIVLSAMTAMALGLFGLAWSTTSEDLDDEIADLVAQPG